MGIISQSCQKAPINGDLDGRWQIMEIETDGMVNNIKDLQLYYSFYLHVCNLSFYGGVFTEGNFTYEEKIIKMDFPYIETEEGNMELSKFGIYSNPVEFQVDFIDKKKLILKEGDNIIITLRKF